MTDAARAISLDDERSDTLSRVLVGQSPLMRDLRATIVRLAPLELPVLVRGESGVGKELVARALHVLSERSGHLVAFNVSESPGSLFADTLFGHVKGAFTGALSSTTGYLLEANHGTVFLDEIGTLQLESQSVLLRAIDQKEFRPVGASKHVQSDFRVVAATNENLEQLALERRFRTDLLYRLKGVTLRVPPLASRIEDIPDLARHFLRRDTRWRGTAYCTDSALTLLERRGWSGNVRELQQVLARAVAFSHAPGLSDREISAALDADADVAVPLRCPASVQPAHPTAERLRDLVHTAAGDTAEVARMLGVSRKTVYRWMGDLGIAPPQRRRFGAQ